MTNTAVAAAEPERTPRTLSIRGRDAVEATLTLDGHDITDALRGYTVTHKVGDIPTVTLDVLAYERAVELDDQRIELHVPEATRDLLVRWGWTPPAEG